MGDIPVNALDRRAQHIVKYRVAVRTACASRPCNVLRACAADRAGRACTQGTAAAGCRGRQAGEEPLEGLVEFIKEIRHAVKRIDRRFQNALLVCTFAAQVHFRGFAVDDALHIYIRFTFSAFFT